MNDLIANEKRMSEIEINFLVEPHVKSRYSQRVCVFFFIQIP